MTPFRRGDNYPDTGGLVGELTKGDFLELEFSLREQGGLNLMREIRHVALGVINARAPQLDTPATDTLCSCPCSSCEHTMKLDDATRYQLLKLIAEHPGYTQRELAAAMGVSVGKANFCIKALISKGLIKAGNFRRNRDKSAYAYLLTPKGIEDKAFVTVRFLQRKMAEYDALRAEIAALRREVDDLATSGLDAGRGAA